MNLELYYEGPRDVKMNKTLALLSRHSQFGDFQASNTLDHETWNMNTT